GLADPHRAALITRLLGHPHLLVPAPEDAAAALEAVRRVVAPLLVALDEASAGGSLYPGRADQRALVVLALCLGALQLRKQRERLPELVDPVALVDEGLRALLTGWGASPSALARALSS